MQLENTKIELYRVRTFTEKLTDTFNFLRENWRPLLKYFMYMMLPVSIVLALPFNHFFEGYFKLLTAIDKGNSFGNMDIWLYGASAVASVLIGVLSIILLQSLVFALIRVYNRRPERMKDLFYTDFRDDLFFCMKRSLIETLVGLAFFFVIAIVVVLLVVLALALGAVGVVFSVLGVILLYVALIALAFPLMMVTPVYLLEDEIGVIEAFKKGLRLGFMTWGGVFALLFIVGILSSVIQTFTMAPWYIMSMVKMIFTLSNDMDKPFLHSFIYVFVQYLTCVLMCLGYMISEILTFVAVTIQYGHASEKIDGAGVSKRIDNFDQFDNF